MPENRRVSRSHAPAWERRPAAPAARGTSRRWSVCTCSHAGAWEPDERGNAVAHRIPRGLRGRWWTALRLSTLRGGLIALRGIMIKARCACARGRVAALRSHRDSVQGTCSDFRTRRDAARAVHRRGNRSGPPNPVFPHRPGRPCRLSGRLPGRQRFPASYFSKTCMSFSDSMREKYLLTSNG